MSSRVRVAVVQAAPVFFDKVATVDKAVALIRDAAQSGARVVLFPEAFIPCYPWTVNLGTTIGRSLLMGHKDFLRFSQNTMGLEDPEAEKLASAARDSEVYLAMGLTEWEGDHLYCSVFFWGPGGGFLGRHRKLKPTGPETELWSHGEGSQLTTVETPFGILGAAICWENYMPLLRAAMYAKRVSLYLAPTADSRPQWQFSAQHIALEGRCFVLTANQYVRKDMIPADLAVAGTLEPEPQVLCRGGSAIISPLGEFLAGPLFDREGILTADLDLALIKEARYDFDPVGEASGREMFAAAETPRS